VGERQSYPLRHVAVLFHGHLPGDQLQQHHPEAVHVGARRQPPSPAARKLRALGRRQPVRVVREQRVEAVVRQLRHRHLVLMTWALGGGGWEDDEDVGGLEVSVRRAVEVRQRLVQIRQPPRHTLSDRQPRRPRQRRPPLASVPCAKQSKILMEIEAGVSQTTRRTHSYRAGGGRGCSRGRARTRPASPPLSNNTRRVPPRSRAGACPGASWCGRTPGAARAPCCAVA
jgi:hypothetical protein